jgi:hypothetical protein
VEGAIKFYEQLAQAQPRTFQTEAAARRAKELSNNPNQIEQLYTGLNQSLTRPHPFP